MDGLKILLALTIANGLFLILEFAMNVFGSLFG